jgi:alpha-N-arabinofuranosidase
VIDPATGAILEGPRFVWEGAGGRFPEAPHLFRRGEYYYLLAAEGGTEYGHVATVARSRSPWGPFEPSPHGPVIDHRSLNSPFQAVGHADFVALDDGTWWAVALGVRPVGHWPRHLLGRETLLTSIHWTADGWPLAGGDGRVEAVTHRPALEPEPAPPMRWVDDFDHTVLAPQWTFVRSPLGAALSLSALPGWLTLQPRGRGMSDWFPCFVGRRQEDYDFVARTVLRQADQRPGDEGGLAVRVNERHALLLAIVRTPTGNEAVVRQIIGSIETVEVLGVVPDGDLTLGLRGTPETYTFFVETSDGLRLESDALETRFMSAEFVGGFTGTFLGLFASSAPDSDAIASFDWFEYLPLESGDEGEANENVHDLQETTA